MLQHLSEQNISTEDPRTAFGIVVHDRREEPRPVVSAWVYGKTRTIHPELPYGKTAA